MSGLKDQTPMLVCSNAVIWRPPCGRAPWDSRTLTPFPTLTGTPLTSSWEMMPSRCESISRNPSPSGRWLTSSGSSTTGCPVPDVRWKMRLAFCLPDSGPCSCNLHYPWHRSMGGPKKNSTIWSSTFIFKFSCDALSPRRRQLIRGWSQPPTRHHPRVSVPSLSSFLDPWLQRVNLCKKTSQMYKADVGADVGGRRGRRGRGRRRTQRTRTSEDANSAPHGTRPGAVRTPAWAPAVHLFIGRSPEAYRTAPGRHPYGLLTGALRLHSTNFHRTPPGRRRIWDHTRRRNENRKGPVRSLKSTASRRVGKIVRGPVDMWPRL